MAESTRMVAPGLLSRRRLPGLLLLLPTVAAGLVAFGIGRDEQADRPTDADLGAAGTTVREAITAQRVTPNDTVIVIAPPWSMRPLVPLGPLSARAIPADGPWDDLVRNRFAHVFVIVEPDAAPWLDGRRILASAKTLARHGRTSVLQVDGVAARFDVRARLDDATVRVRSDSPDDDGDDDDDAVVCTQRTRGSNGGVRCPGLPSFVRVAREWALVTENGADVVFAHPPPKGQRLEIAFGNDHDDDDRVEFGRELVVAAGHTRAGADRADPIAGEVRLAVVVDGEVVATLKRRPSFVRERHRRGSVAVFVNDTANANRTVDLDDDDRGFRVDRIDTARFAGSTHRLSFLISTDAEANNGFAFDAFIPGGP